MRVPPQRSSRSNTAPSGGKRISTSSSTSNAASSSGKKRKLHSDSSTKPTHKQSPDASTSNTGSKRKPSLPNVRKTTYHPKRADTASSTKNPKSDSGIKKSQTRKSISIPLVGLKKIKIKEGKVTVKKILMTAAATKSQKKIVKSSVKCTPSKKSVTGGNKKTAGTSTSSVEAVSASSTGELQAASSSSVGRTSGESEDQNPSQKKTQCRNPASSKFNTKKTKVIIKKSKAPSITSVPVPLTRTKKLQQTQNLKSVKKICLKKYPATKQVMVQQATIGKKKKIITRKKNTTGENSGNGEGQVTQKSNESPSSNQNEGQSSAAADNVQSGTNVSATQSAEKGSGKGNTKKAKDEESAIKKSDKKKIVKKKPKMEDSGKGSTAVSEEAPSEIISETTKEETVASPKKENKNDNKDETATKGKCVKKSKAIPSESSAVKGKSTKKPPIVKSVKVISTKLKKITDSKPSNSKVKKVQQPKKKIPKSSVKKIVAKEQLPIDTKQEVSEGKERKPPKNTESNDEDSSTSDEITLDVLLMRQQMKQENITSDDTSPEQQTASEPCSPVSSTEKLSSPQDIENKSYIPLMSSVKVEESAPSSTVATLSPATVNTSDDEDLKSIKNKIKIKLEESNTDDGKKSPAMPDKTSKKKSVATKSKTSDSSASRSKYVGTSIKKEPKDDSDKSEKKKSESDSKSSSDKDRPKKVLGVKKSATGVKRTRSESGKNGSSGSDTEQRARRMKLFGFWSGIKRHRVASLNALAKVHCLYENESRGALLGLCGASSNSSPRAPKSTPAPVNVSTEVTVTTTRTLRSAPGLRGMGKHWDMHNASSTSSSSTSSDENESNSDSATSTPPPSYKQKRRQQKVTTTTTTSSSSCGIKKKTTKQIKNLKKVVKRRRNRCELMMDLKDMVVRKRMASLNASAILAASYSVEKRPAKTNKDETGCRATRNQKIVEVEDDSSSISSDVEVEECDLEGRGSSRSVIEVRTTPSGGGSSNKKVAVILNQDTDVTITGVYVNSTTRSTHHEGFCSIAGMQYRISSTSHTQTEATAVATETVLHTSTAAEHVSIKLLILYVFFR
ncbi:hypothetical protein ANN_22229 [Periplaneta americana]|uniref:Uncharacterized protein n=1 Tax=Periplaneta americana TaxID=6978 RepID=A0ABQ8S7Z6_PERAM|nr:hypothetical protein ANN_22229 [Periplaneta americana]